MKHTELLAQAILAAHDGQIDEAKTRFLTLLETDEQNEQAWLWLAKLVDDPEERRICLENVLMINPANAYAQRNLATLQGKTGLPPWVEAEPDTSSAQWLDLMLSDVNQRLPDWLVDQQLAPQSVQFGQVPRRPSARAEEPSRPVEARTVPHPDHAEKQPFQPDRELLEVFPDWLTSEQLTTTPTGQRLSRDQAAPLISQQEQLAAWLETLVPEPQEAVEADPEPEPAPQTQQLDEPKTPAGADPFAPRLRNGHVDDIFVSTPVTSERPPAAASPVTNDHRPIVLLPAPSSFLSIPSRHTAMEEKDAEEPCPFCGATTRLTDHACPSCNTNLMIRERPEARRSVALTLLIAMYSVNTLLVVGQAVLTILSILIIVLQASLAEQELPVINTIPMVARFLFTALTLGIMIGLWRKRAWAYLLHTVGTGLVIASIFGMLVSTKMSFMSDVLPLLGLAHAEAAGSLGGLGFIVALVALTLISYGDFFGRRIRMTTTGLMTSSDAYNLGLLYRDNGMWFMAAHAWERAVMQNPRDPQVRRALGLAYAQIKLYDAAIDILKTAIALDPENKQVRGDLDLVTHLANKARRDHSLSPH
ncbi:tetratricopeptide repeat protein [Candidatus Chloroploca sp. M-50]|uniref:Tetratricopeptide repeat protein n=1 Tax=Candidatus Chloroploca mongolica TaxID=2528176 RepID=A0ABS4DFK8_9CHLR|nr:tetratricopeptide repeat protein [Candidatus Chloroploca mongolica]MBP1468149.1 tetratricopeptide repeat protein [Candidatus Chloroploca mongolica]